jgi:hypothetical protein
MELVPARQQVLSVGLPLFVRVLRHSPHEFHLSGGCSLPARLP